MIKVVFSTSYCWLEAEIRSTIVKPPMHLEKSTHFSVAINVSLSSIDQCDISVTPKSRYRDKNHIFDIFCIYRIILGNHIALRFIGQRRRFI